MGSAMSSWARAYAPPARRGHRAERHLAGDYVPAPFARVNQDCVDVIVEYAACSVDAVLQLRRVSRGVAAGVMNHFALVYRRARDNGAPSNPLTFVTSERTVGPLAGLAPFDAEPFPTGRHAFLAALYCNAPLAAEYDRIYLWQQTYGGRTSDSLVRPLVSRYPRITELVVYCDRGLRLGDAGLLAVADKCTALRRVSLWLEPGTSASSLLALTSKCPDLEVFSVAEPTGFISASVLESVGQHCPRLTFLALRGSPESDANFNSAARRFGNLTMLALSGSTARCIDDVLVAFAENCPRLQDVYVTGCNITDVALTVLADKCPDFQRLNASGCAGVTAAGVVIVARKCRQLTDLHLPRTACTKSVLEQLAEHGSQLRRLDLSDASGRGIVNSRGTVGDTCAIDVESVAALLRACTRLSALVMSSTHITGAEIATLQGAFPKHKIGCS